PAASPPTPAGPRSSPTTRLGRSSPPWRPGRPHRRAPLLPRSARAVRRPPLAGRPARGSSASPRTPAAVDSPGHPHVVTVQTPLVGRAVQLDPVTVADTTQQRPVAQR